MNDKRTIVGLLLMVLLWAGLAACQNEEQENTPEVTAPSETSPVDDVNAISVSTGLGTVTAEGEVQPLRSAQLSFQTGGTVDEILVSAGDDVTEGDPLIRLDAIPLENALRQAEAGEAAAQASLQAAQAQLAVAESGIATAEAAMQAAIAQLALVQTGATPEQIAAAEKNLAAAEAAIVTAAGNRDAAVRVSDAEVQSAIARLTEAQAQADQLQQAYDDILDACFDLPDGSEICPLYGPVEENTRFQLEAAKANVTAAQTAVNEARTGATPAEAYLAGSGITLAQAQRDQAQAQLDLIQEPVREELVQQAQVGVDQAEVGQEQARVAITQAQAAVTQAEAGLVTSQANVEEARKALERMTLTAPFDGRIGEVNAEVGELVGPGLALIRIGDFSGWQVETTDLTELDVVGVKLGLPAEVRIDALPGEVVNGEVIDIAAVSELIRGDVTYPVTVLLEETDLPLRWGMTATVDVETE